MGRTPAFPAFPVFLALLLAACARPPRLSPFRSDGCSLFPDKDYASGESWCGCCVEHDYAYWKGGDEAERRKADRALEACVLGRTGDSTLARAIHAGTRAGGQGYFPTWYRWGYGWPYRSGPVPDSLRRSEVRARGGTDLAAWSRRVCGE